MNDLFTDLGDLIILARNPILSKEERDDLIDNLSSEHTKKVGRAILTQNPTEDILADYEFVIAYAHGQKQ